MKSEEVFHYLRTQVTSGSWQPGEKIPSERELGEQLGVSRVSVRAAVNRMIGIGLLNSRQGGGTYVTHMMDSVSLFEFRRILECETVGLAAIRASQEEILHLQEINHAMEEASDEAEIARCDMEFHMGIAKASRNTLIYMVMDQFKDAFYAMFEKNIEALGKQGADVHQEIITSMLVRDPEAAKQIMRQHLQNTERVRLKGQTLSGRGERF